MDYGPPGPTYPFHPAPDFWDASLPLTMEDVGRLESLLLRVNGEEKDTVWHTVWDHLQLYKQEYFKEDGC